MEMKFADNFWNGDWKNVDTFFQPIKNQQALITEIINYCKDCSAYIDVFAKNYSRKSQSLQSNNLISSFSPFLAFFSKINDTWANVLTKLNQELTEISSKLQKYLTKCLVEQKKYKKSMNKSLLESNQMKKLFAKIQKAEKNLSDKNDEYNLKKTQNLPSKEITRLLERVIMAENDYNNLAETYNRRLKKYLPVITDSLSESQNLEENYVSTLYDFMHEILETNVLCFEKNFEDLTSIKKSATKMTPSDAIEGLIKSLSLGCNHPESIILSDLGLSLEETSDGSQISKSKLSKQSTNPSKTGVSKDDSSIEDSNSDFSSEGDESDKDSDKKFKLVIKSLDSVSGNSPVQSIGRPPSVYRQDKPNSLSGSAKVLKDSGIEGNSRDFSLDKSLPAVSDPWQVTGEYPSKLPFSNTMDVVTTAGNTPFKQNFTSASNISDPWEMIGPTSSKTEDSISNNLPVASNPPWYNADQSSDIYSRQNLSFSTVGDPWAVTEQSSLSLNIQDSVSGNAGLTASNINPSTNLRSNQPTHPDTDSWGNTSRASSTASVNKFSIADQGYYDSTTSQKANLENNPQPNVYKKTSVQHSSSAANIPLTQRRPTIISKPSFNYTACPSSKIFQIGLSVAEVVNLKHSFKTNSNSTLINGIIHIVLPTQYLKMLAESHFKLKPLSFSLQTLDNMSLENFIVNETIAIKNTCVPGSDTVIHIKPNELEKSALKSLNSSDNNSHSIALAKYQIKNVSNVMPLALLHTISNTAEGCTVELHYLIQSEYVFSSLKISLMVPGNLKDWVRYAGSVPSAEWDLKNASLNWTLIENRPHPEKGHHGVLSARFNCPQNILNQARIVCVFKSAGSSFTRTQINLVNSPAYSVSSKRYLMQSGQYFADLSG